MKKKLRVLIADDDDDVRGTLKDMLVGEGFHIVAEARDGGEALGIFQQNPDGFDLVVTDYKMPRMDGVKLAHGIRTFRPDMPVIIRTAIPEYVASSSEYVVVSKAGGVQKLLEAINMALNRFANE